ncbi:eCIS core domain-containing protein [Streptomyces cyaneofuscatus]|uniref:eCIS core domain-containing protein n=1 Tax=Streptomyces cyaneofuscatus TaxID=66883 RepID=UPI003F4D2DCB
MHGRAHHPDHDEASPTRPPAGRGVRVPALAEQKVRPDAPLPPATADFLQRSIGNAALAQMIEDERHVHDPSRSHHPGTAAAAESEANTPVQRSSVHDVLRSPGRPLAEPVRTEMELRLGEGFESVRIHDGASAARSASEIGARAYTSGDHVVLGQGGTDKHTLAHELTHVIQQRRGPVTGTDTGSGLRVSDPSDHFERAAEANATAALARPLPAPAADRDRLLSPGPGPVPLGGAQSAGHAPPAPIQRAPSTRSSTAAGTAAPVASQAALTNLPADEKEGECGYFERRRQLSVNPPQQGLIIQEINRVFAVQQWDGSAWTALPAANIDSYVTARGSDVFATVGRYWELWIVDAQGNVSDGGEDTFSLASIIPGKKRKDTTRGTYTITGDAAFYPTTVAPGALGFTQGGAGPAGGLFSTLTDPSGASRRADSSPPASRSTARSTWRGTAPRRTGTRPSP